MCTEGRQREETQGEDGHPQPRHVCGHQKPGDRPRAEAAQGSFRRSMVLLTPGFRASASRAVRRQFRSLSHSASGALLLRPQRNNADHYRPAKPSIGPPVSLLDPLQPVLHPHTRGNFLKWKIPSSHARHWLLSTSERTWWPFPLSTCFGLTAGLEPSNSFP